MFILNSITNTNPLVAHAQGGSYRSKQFQDISKLSDKISKPSSDLTIITFAYGRERAMLVEQLKNSKINFINCAASYKGVWENKYKIQYFKNALDSVTTKYVIGLDSLDIILTEDCFDEIIQRFESLNCKALFGSSKANYPDITDDNDETASPWKYLNGGTLIGETEYIKTFYEHLIVEFEKNYDNFDFSEQVRIRKIWNDFKPDVKADYNCDIFQTINQSEYIYNNETRLITITS